MVTHTCSYRHFVYNTIVLKNKQYGDNIYIYFYGFKVKYANSKFQYTYSLRKIEFLTWHFFFNYCLEFSFMSHKNIYNS